MHGRIAILLAERSFPPPPHADSTAERCCISGLDHPSWAFLAMVDGLEAQQAKSLNRAS
jgi:hypothetical protein